MENFKILIVEDNPGFALEMEILVKEAGYDLIGVVNNSEDAIEMVRSKNPDLVVMDINIMGKKNGVEVAKEIKDDEVPVIFVTSITDKSVFSESKEAFSFAYLVKPFDMLTLQSAIEFAVRSLSGEEEGAFEVGNADKWEEDLIVNDNFLIKSKGILKKVRGDEVNYVESDWNYCVLVTEEKRYAVKISLKKILTMFGKEKFVPIHKSYIVQFNKIEGIDTTANKVLLGETVLPLGRTYREDLLNRFKLLK